MQLETIEELNTEFEELKETIFSLFLNELSLLKEEKINFITEINKLGDTKWINLVFLEPQNKNSPTTIFPFGNYDSIKEEEISTVLCSKEKHLFIKEVLYNLKKICDTPLFSSKLNELAKTFLNSEINQDTHLIEFTELLEVHILNKKINNKEEHKILKL